MAAWRISRVDSKIYIEEVKQHVKNAKKHIARDNQEVELDAKDLWLHPDFVNTHPEVIMEVVGYARSPLRTEGLHLLVDVGATTLDVATFIIRSQDGTDVFPLLETGVERFGTMILHDWRVQALKEDLQNSLQHVNSIDPTIPLPDSSHYVIQIGNQDISKRDESFFQECLTKIGEVIKLTKHDRDPNSSVWSKGLPVFVCGGGGRLQSYMKVIKVLSERLNKITSIKSFNIKEIPKPDQLEAPDLSYHDYDRLAVAYGLSHTSDEIGEVIPASKIENIRRGNLSKIIEDRFVSKDMC